MEHLIVYLMLGLGLVALLTALLAIATWLSSKSGGHPRTTYGWKLLGSVSYFALGADGLLATPYLSHGNVLNGALSLLFIAIGVFLLRSGLKMQRQAKA